MSEIHHQPVELTTQSQFRWVRSDNGVFAGICQEIADRTKTDPLIARIILLISMMFFGIGFIPYIYLWIALPKRSQLDQATTRKILGVCASIAKRSGYDVGLVRLAALVLATLTFGTALMVYMIIYVVENLSDQSLYPRR